MLFFVGFFNRPYKVCKSKISTCGVQMVLKRPIAKTSCGTCVCVCVCTSETITTLTVCPHKDLDVCENALYE